MRVKAFVALTLVVLAFSGPSRNVSAKGPRASGEILVKFRPGTKASDKADAHRQAGGTRRAEITRTGVELVEVAVGDESSIMARYHRNPNVLYAEPNFVRYIPEIAAHPPGSEVVPRDYYFDEEWGLHNTGQLFQCIPWPFPPPDELCFYVGTPDADIDAPEAWATSTGSPTVKVAVIDSGVDYNHPDLAANYAGGDDFTVNDGDPMDDHGHGTHVAGTIAAAINNLTGSPGREEGVVGVAPTARILAYKVCLADGTCTDFAIQQAIAQAITDGAKVINMSLGDPVFSQTLYDAVQDAWNAGLVIVAGAGNFGGTPQETDFFYPAAFANVISVAAFDEDHRRAAFSSYSNNWVDISAPGNVIMSTYPLAACGGGSTVPGDTGCYEWLSGTSMATPHVSGAAALVWSRSDVTTNTEVVNILLQSANPTGVSPVRLDSWTIHGGLNIHDALSYGALNQAPVANAGADQTLVDNDRNGTENVTLNGTASSDSDGSIVSYQWREGSTSVATGATPTISLSVGAHTLTLTVTDDDGATGTDVVLVTVQAPPVANAGPDQTVVDNDRNGTENVTLNGSASSDPDGSIVTYQWREGANTVATGATPTVTLSVGAHTLTLLVTDNHGLTGTDVVVVTVQAPPAADTVTITKATYSSRFQHLTVEATSTGAPNATLTAYDASNPSNHVVVGQLTYNPKRARYAAVFSWPTKPSSIVVRSSGGGSATSGVGGK